MPSMSPRRMPDEIWQNILKHFRPSTSDSLEAHTAKVRVLRTVCLIDPGACRVARGYLLENVTINLLSPWEMNTFLRYLYRFPEDAKLVKNVLLVLGERPRPRALPSRLTQNDLDLIRVTAAQVAGRLTARPYLGRTSELRNAQDELVDELQSDPRRPFLHKDLTWTPREPSNNDTIDVDHLAEHASREPYYWDTLGQPEPKWETIAYYESANAIVLVLDKYRSFLTALCCNTQLIELHITPEMCEEVDWSSIDLTAPVDYIFHITEAVSDTISWSLGSQQSKLSSRRRVARENEPEQPS